METTGDPPEAPPDSYNFTVDSFTYEVQSQSGALDAMSAWLLTFWHHNKTHKPIILDRSVRDRRCSGPGHGGFDPKRAYELMFVAVVALEHCIRHVREKGQGDSWSPLVQRANYTYTQGRAKQVDVRGTTETMLNSTVAHRPTVCPPLLIRHHNRGGEAVVRPEVPKQQLNVSVRMLL